MCDYCNGNKKIKESTLTETYYSYRERIPINYCPMCGSRLREEGDNSVS